MINYKPNTKLHIFVGYTTLLGGLLASASAAIGLNVLSLIATDSTGLGLLALPGGQAHLVTWSFALSCIGNYLLLTPLAIIASQGHHEQQLVKQLTRITLGLFGLGYLLLGAVGAALLGASWPENITAYQAASVSEQEQMAALILQQQQQLESNYHGPLQNCLGAIWFAGLAVLYRPLSKPVILITSVLALALGSSFFGGLLTAPITAQLGMAASLLLMPIWALLLGFQMRFTPWQLSPDAVAVPETTG